MRKRKSLRGFRTGNSITLMRVLLTVTRGRGAPRSIELDAPSLDYALVAAAQEGYTVLSCRASAVGRSPWTGRRGTQKLQVAVFVEQLQDLLAAGLSVMEALGALQLGVLSSEAASIEQLAQRLREGKTLSQALEADPIFPPLLVALVRTSELTSDLPQCLARYLEHDRRVSEVRHRLTSTAVYPLMLMAVGGLVLLFLLLHVVPRFARVFEGMTGDLPWSARAMVAWSHLLGGHGVWVLASAGATLVALVAAAASPRLRARGLNALMAWAPLRERLKPHFLSRWYRATGMLVEGGIPLPQALPLSNGLLPEALRAGGQSVLRGVNQGLSPSAAYAKAGMATPVAEQLMLAGERTGDLGSVLMRIAQFHESEIARSLEKAMRVMEPAVMVLVGVGVGLVVVLMYMPIFELASAIQ